MLVVVAAITYLTLRRIRRYHYEPKLIPGSYLKRKWQEWAPKGSYRKVSSRQSRARAESNPTEYAPTTEAAEEARATIAVEDGVDRRQSVRSVMTLPPYSYSPKPTEQILGREGERAGMDIVAEFPETVDQEENRREDEMESLYQIRQARRQEIADRESRRQARREARERGDQQALEALQRESRVRADSTNAEAPPSAAAMLVEHQSRGRQRRTSAVTYGALGLVRHDGTRVRSESQESERGGLLDGAAPMAGGQHGRTISQGSTLPTPPFARHGRNRSASSALSISTTATEVERVVTPNTQPPNSGGRQSQGARSSESSDANGLTPATTRYTPEESHNSEGGDIGDSIIPPHVPSAGTEPPDYDNLDWGDAPAYSSPIRPPGETPHTSRLERQLAERRLTGGANRQSIGSQISTSSPGGGNRQNAGSPTVASPRGEFAQPAASSATSSNALESDRGAKRTSRASGVNRIPTLAPQLPQLQRLPTINVHHATEPNTPSSPTQPRSSQTA